MINVSIKDLAHYQRTFSEAIKFPMAMKTAEAMEVSIYAIKAVEEKRWRTTVRSRF